MIQGLPRLPVSAHPLADAQPGFHAGLGELLIERREHRVLTNGVLPRQSGRQLNRLVSSEGVFPTPALLLERPAPR
jgi:hypothetical protein